MLTMFHFKSNLASLKNIKGINNFHLTRQSSIFFKFTQYNFSEVKQDKPAERGTNIFT